MLMTPRNQEFKSLSKYQHQLYLVLYIYHIFLARLQMIPKVGKDFIVPHSPCPQMRKTSYVLHEW